MYETFEKLPESRKEQILKACIAEFARNGYKNTSTNTMVKRLGISKGLLFLYFTSKRHLYLYLIDYLMVFTVDRFFEMIADDPPKPIDVFNNLGEYYKKLFLSNPDYTLFLLEAFLNTPPELKDEIESQHGQAHAHILEHLNTEGFRKDIDLNATVDLIHFATFHIGQMAREIRVDDLDDFSQKLEECLETFNKYMDIIKYGVYDR